MSRNGEIECSGIIEKRNENENEGIGEENGDNSNENGVNGSESVLASISNQHRAKKCVMASVSISVKRMWRRRGENGEIAETNENEENGQWRINGGMAKSNGGEMAKNIKLKMAKTSIIMASKGDVA
jgi:hypothetical protein